MSLIKRITAAIFGAPRPAIIDGVWRSVIDAIPILHGLDAEEDQRLRSLAEGLLADKDFALAGGAEVDDFLLVGLSAQACLPILNLGAGGYRDWRTLILYPGEFVTPRHEVDEAGVHHRWEEEASGEAWEDGPVILSVADVAASGVGDGYNVVIHEMAHKLDLLDGDANGFPPLHEAMDRKRWFEVFSEAFSEITAQVERDEETPIDDYAASEPAEFFAVVSEYFFELPEVLRDAYPEVYSQLVQFYRQDPGARLVSDWRPLIP
jgi:Mlc titration factor MtfA (ptsG expression regulator)